MTKLHWIIAALAAALIFLAGFFTGKAVYDRPIGESVTHDTVTVHDTIPDYNPGAKDSTAIKTVIKWLPLYKHTTDTIDHFVEVSTMVHDTVAVEVPITSKHYGSEQYDAWVSGYEPSLDSIKVYQKTDYITTTVTQSKPPNRFSVGLQGGYGYGFRSKTWEPYVGVGVNIRIL